MNTDTKRHIDAARQVLVGVVPNPTSQIDQITYALIYKFMDDMDQAAIKNGDEPAFFTGDLEPYSWARLMDTRIGNQARMNRYVEAFQKFAEAKQLPELFRNILKSAFLPYRQPETLGLFLKEIDFFDYSHPEELGNGYEYLLSIMSSQGDAGQFRTPRHIIDFIVSVISPSINDRVLDPACGTAGFLISSFKHILKQHDGIDDPEKKEKPLTPDQRRNLMSNFEGYDIDPGMVRIAQVNMYLHQFKNPQIFQYDTLTSEERWNDKFDVIMANPPFMSPKGGIKPHNKFSIQSSRSEVLFVDYIMNHLRPKGRAGIIVPEGIIFQSGSSHKQLRKNLVSDGLYAVVSLPSGVFQPYSGVKTSILFLDNELAKQSKEILFIKVGNDGFDLGATKRPISKNDLPVALEIVQMWYLGEKVESKLAVYVEKTKIAESGDYNLSGDRYRVTTDYSNAKWPMVKLEEVVEILDNKRKPITKSDRVAGRFPYYGATGIVDYVDDYIFDERLVLIGEDGAKWDKGDKTAFIAEGKCWVNNHAHVLRPLRKVLIDTFLVSYLNSIDVSPFITGVTVPKLNQEKLRSIKIPLPPFEIQEQIVAEIDGYENIIFGAKQIVASWKPKIDIDPEWEIKKLSDVCTQITDGTHRTPKYKVDGIPFLRVTDVTGSNESKRYISEEEYNELTKRCNPQKGDVLYTKNGTIGIAKMIDWDYKFSIFVSLALLKPKQEVLSGKYLEYFLNSNMGLSQAKAHSKSGTVTNLHLVEIQQFQIPVPSLEIQKKIVYENELEHSLVESAKKLIGIYEQKTKDAISKLWTE